MSRPRVQFRRGDIRVLIGAGLVIEVLVILVASVVDLAAVTIGFMVAASYILGATAVLAVRERGDGR